MKTIFYIIGIIAYFVISWFMAGQFYKIAEDKGYGEKKYFWFCFLLTIVGYLLICAMPDRSYGQTVVTNDDLPDL